MLQAHELTGSSGRVQEQPGGQNWDPISTVIDCTHFARTLYTCAWQAPTLIIILNMYVACSVCFTYIVVIITTTL